MRKELESLGSDVSRAETNTKAAQKDYDDKQQELKVLQEQFKAADEVRQKAYGHWRDLKNESIRKVRFLLISTTLFHSIGSAFSIPIMSFIQNLEWNLSQFRHLSYFCISTCHISVFIMYLSQIGILLTF